jgi:NTP pyrophosphatase (non-canonical NTP hydrolase)
VANARATATETTAERDQWAERHAERAIAAYHKKLTAAMGEVISEIRHELRTEFNEALTSLRADLTIQTAIAKGEIAEIKRNVA